MCLKVIVKHSFSLNLLSLHHPSVLIAAYFTELFKGQFQYLIRIHESSVWNTMDHFRHYSLWIPGKVSSRFNRILSGFKGFISYMILGLKSQRAFDHAPLICSFTIYSVCSFIYILHLYLMCFKNCRVVEMDNS